MYFFLDWKMLLVFSFFSFLHFCFVTPWLVTILFVTYNMMILFSMVCVVYQVAWSADSAFLVSCSKDSTIKLWSVKNTKKALHTLPGHEDEVRTLSFHIFILFYFILFYFILFYFILFVDSNSYLIFIKLPDLKFLFSLICW